MIFPFGYSLRTSVIRFIYLYCVNSIIEGYIIANYDGLLGCNMQIKRIQHCIEIIEESSGLPLLEIE